MFTKSIIICCTIFITGFVLAETNNKYNSDNVQKFKKSPVEIKLNDSTIYKGQILTCRSNDFAVQTEDGQRIFLNYSKVISITVRQGKVAQKNFSKVAIYTLAILLGLWLGANTY
ncbi:MAG: hypothetical protein ISR95_00345 [Candidatus Marinimicrobia bacterium]|nr:hypothetical protein [Candidatus Neomarinimicrobiota bacterium]MBL7046080.1 hypothetical protein [Candidatus Neomarinimicrobiota bacterium]